MKRFVQRSADVADAALFGAIMVVLAAKIAVDVVVFAWKEGA